MTVIAHYELSCNRCGTGYPAPLTAIGSAAKIRDAAADDGWQVATHRKRQDLCPECRPAS